MRALAFAAAGFALAVTAAAVADDSALPSPSSPGAGDAHAAAFESSLEPRVREGLGRFDAWLASHPRDVDAAVERCRFLGAVADDEEGFRALLIEEADACAAELEREFGGTLAARAYLAESQWGDEGIDASRALLDEGVRGTPYELAVTRHLAEALAAEDRAKEAVPHARRAMALDPSLDLSLALARGLDARGERGEAIAALEARLDSDGWYWERTQKADLLREWGAHEAAVQVYTRLDTHDDLADHLGFARSLAALARIDEAREQYRRQAAAEHDYQGHSDDARRELFRLELAHGDSQTAWQAYQALRDEGFAADPLGRRRAQLLLAHPRAAWRWRDLVGFAALLGSALALAALPLALLAPVHYAGLWLARRRPFQAPLPSLFGLRRAWLACGLLLAGQLAGVFYLPIEELIAATSTDLGALLDAVPRRDLALLAVVTVLGTGAAALAAAGARLPVLLRRGAWSAGRTFWIGLGCAVALTPLALLGRLAERALADAVLTERLLRALNAEFGGATLIALVALITPLAEEILFRGVLLSAFSRHLPFAWANAVQAMLFAALHGELAALPFLVAFGLVCGALTRRSGSLRAAIWCHALNNGVACAGLILAAQRTAA